MTAVIVAALLLTAAMGSAVALTRDPVRQALVLSGFGLVLAVLFLALQAPDVALSQVAVGAVAQPLLFLLALDRVRSRD